jgi:peptide/nickel transport system permease protein
LNTWAHLNAGDRAKFVQVQLDQVELAMRRADWAGALKLCNRVLSMDPGNQRAAAVRHSINYALGQTAPATPFPHATVKLIKSILSNRITKRFYLMLFIIWVAATVMFVVPRQFGLNPSQAGWFSPSPQRQALDDLIEDLRSEREQTLSGIDGNDVPPEIQKAISALDAQIAERTTRTAFERQFGFGDPLIVQYRRYIFALAQFDLGSSRRYFPVTVFEVIRSGLFWTLGLMGVSIVIAFTIGSLSGGLMAWPSSPGLIRYGFMPLLAVSSIPYYLLGLLLIWFLAFKWGWFPLSGGWDIYDPTLRPNWSISFMIDALHHAVLPALSIILTTVGFWTVTMRSLMINLQGEDYAIFAAAKGLKNRRNFLHYGMRNAILPQVTGLVASAGSILTGVLLVEIVFRYPGIGLLFWLAVRGRDVTMMTGLAFVIIVVLAISMFLLDLLLPLLDRRIKDQPG